MTEQPDRHSAQQDDPGTTVRFTGMDTTFVVKPLLWGP